MSDKVYQGTRDAQGWVVEVTTNGQPLHNYGSSDGFEWGYGGSGPHSLALSILCDYFNVPPVGTYEDWNWRSVPAWAYYWSAFLADVVSQLSARQNFTLTSHEIEEWMARNRPHQEGEQHVLALIRS